MLLFHAFALLLLFCFNECSCITQGKVYLYTHRWISAIPFTHLHLFFACCITFDCLPTPWNKYLPYLLVSLEILVLSVGHTQQGLSSRGCMWRRAMSCPMRVTARPHHLWNQCGWPSHTRAAAKQWIPLHPSTDVSQRQQQPFLHRWHSKGDM